MKNYDILKKFCKRIYQAGSGNFWYEAEVGNDTKTYYKILNTLLLFTYCFITLLELLAALFGDLPKDEKSDAITFSVSHTIVMIKLYSVIVNKELIKQLLYDLVHVCELHEEQILMIEKFRIVKINITAYVCIVYGSFACFVFEGLRKVYNGSHFVTVVTYYPFYTDNSITAAVIRTSTTFILFIMLISMITTVDGFTVVNIIIFKYKLITLRHYFEKLREDVEMLCNRGDNESAASKLSIGLVEGIVMHRELLRIFRQIEKAFKTVMALQLCQSSGSAVSLLLQIALSEDLNFVARMKIIFFVAGLFFMLGLFLCNAGEITYQASLLSESIFYCGWHLIPCKIHRGRQLRKIVLFACTRAQLPLTMKAFKMIDLTYATFLLVVRSTYSVFALFYAQNQ